MASLDFDLLYQQIKKDFFSLRNGIVAEILRKVDKSHQFIYGLTVPEFISLSKKYPKDMILGLKLWNDKKTRESRLFSLYLIPVTQLEKNKVIEMIKDVSTREEAEMLAFKILRYLPYAKELLEEMSIVAELSSESHHCINMLEKNLNQT